jgi:hypothetical protein
MINSDSMKQAVFANGQSYVDPVDTIRPTSATISEIGNMESLGSVVTGHNRQCGSQETSCKEQFIGIHNQLANADFLPEFTLPCFESDDSQIHGH